LPLTVVPSLEAMALSKQPKCERVFLRIHDIAVVHVADHGGVGTVRRAWSTGERATGLFWHEWLARQRAMPQEPEPSVEDLLYSGKVPSHVQKDSDSDSGQTMCPAVDPTQGEQHQDAETLSEPSLVRPPITMAVPTSKPESPPPHGNVQLNKQGFCVRHPWIQVRRKKGYIFKQWEVLYDQCPLCRADAMQLVDDSATAQQDASKSYEIKVAGISEDVSDVSAKDNTFGEGLDDLLTVVDAGDEDEFNRKGDTSCQPHGLKDIKVSQNELAQSSLEKHNNERVKALKDRVNKMVEKALSPADRRSLRLRVESDIELARQYEAHWRNHAVVTTQAREDAVLHRMRKRVQRLKANKKKFDRDAMYAAAMGTASMTPSSFKNSS